MTDLDGTGGKEPRSFIVRYWRGGYSLAFSYWAVGLLTNFTAALTLIGITRWANAIRYNPVILWCIFVGTVLVILTIYLWHSVGLWRSAGRSIGDRNRSTFWGVVVRILCIAGLVNLANSLVTINAPQLIELSNMAFRGDPDIPDYRITVSADGSEITIDGGIKYGMTEAFAKVADAGAKVVALNSPGGRIGEAAALFHVIHDRGFATVTNTRCLSACTIVFAAGRERWVGPGARIGFHSASFVGLKDAAMRSSVEGILNTIASVDGVPSGFLDRGFRVPASDMWYPTLDELFDNRFITSKASHAGSSIALIGEQLGRVRGRLLATLPKQIDGITVLVSAYVEKNTFVYVYDLSDYDPAFFTIRANLDQMERAIREGVCKNSQLRSDVELGVIYGYLYHDKATQRQLSYISISQC